jgi:hypothetical protein
MCLTVLCGQILNFQEGWCDSQGTLEEVRVKLQKRQEGAIKRERAIAYVYSQHIEGVPKCNVRTNSSAEFYNSGIIDLNELTIFLFCSNRRTAMVGPTSRVSCSSTSTATRTTAAGAGWRGGWRRGRGRTD